MKNKKNENELEDIPDAVLQGRYRDSYLVYCRRSTDEPDSQKNSLSYQRANNARYAHVEELPVADVTIEAFCRDGVICEKHSAFKDKTPVVVNDDGTVQLAVERPKFRRLIRYLSRGYFKGVIFFCWDRASRNKADSAIIRKLERQGVDLQFATTRYDKSSSGELHKDIDDMFSNHHSRVTAEKVKSAVDDCREKGLCTYQAPVGYLNLGRMDRKPIDPERAPVVRRMFELAAEGWSLLAIAQWAESQGFTMPPKSRRRSKLEKLLDDEDDSPPVEKLTRPARYTTIHQILRNRFYIGMVRDHLGGWTISRSHEGLVSAQLFARVQEQLSSRYRGAHYVEPLDVPFRAMLRCHACKRVYTPYYKKGICYLTCRCRSGCGNGLRNIALRHVEEEIRRAIEQMRPTAQEVREIEARLCEGMDDLEAKRQAAQDEAARQLKKAQDDLAYLRENKLTLLKSRVYSPEEFVQEEERLSLLVGRNSNGAESQSVAPAEVVRDFNRASELLNLLVDHWHSVEMPKRQLITRTVFSELWVSETGLCCKATPSLRLFQDRFISSCAPHCQLSELAHLHQELNSAIRQLEAIIPRAQLATSQSPNIPSQEGGAGALTKELLGCHSG